MTTGGVAVISTLIPTYRRPALLARAIRSALKQSYPNVRVCVYDNASGDETPQVVADIARGDSRVRYHCHHQNLGAGRNFAYALEQVDTPLFSILADDDVLLPDSYSIAVRAFEEFPEAALVAGSLISINESGSLAGVSAPWPRYGCYVPPDGLMEMFTCSHLIWTSILFRRQVLESCPFVQGHVSFIIDIDFVLRVTTLFPFVVVPDPFAIGLVHPTSASSTADPLRLYSDWVGVQRWLQGLAKVPVSMRDQLDGLLERQLKQRLWRTGLDALNCANFALAEQIESLLVENHQARASATRLHMLANTQRHASWLYKTVRWANQLRQMPSKLRTQRQLQQLRAQYGHYLNATTPRPEIIEPALPADAGTLGDNC